MERACSERAEKILRGEEEPIDFSFDDNVLLFLAPLVGIIILKLERLLVDAVLDVWECLRA